MPSIILWTWTRNQKMPSSPIGFHSLKRIRARSRSSPCGLSFEHLGDILPLKSQIHECQKTFALCSIILRAHSRTRVRFSRDCVSIGVNTSENFLFGLNTLITASFSSHPPISRCFPASSSISKNAETKSRLISHCVFCRVLRD